MISSKTCLSESAQPCCFMFVFLIKGWRSSSSNHKQFNDHAGLSAVLWLALAGCGWPWLALLAAAGSGWFCLKGWLLAGWLALAGSGWLLAAWLASCVSKNAFKNVPNVVRKGYQTLTQTGLGNVVFC